MPYLELGSTPRFDLSREWDPPEKLNEFTAPMGELSKFFTVSGAAKFDRETVLGRYAISK